MLHRTRRIATDLVNPAPHLRQVERPPELPLAASSTTPLWGETDPREAALQRGKVHNLRLIAQRLDRTWIPAGETFSFWRQVGPPWRINGFVRGRQVQLGCIVPAIGGGICQLTNSLYQVALQSRCDIQERHGHTVQVGGFSGPDATVAWNYVDLRFAPKSDTLLRVCLSADELHVELRAKSERQAATLIPIADNRSGAGSCATCGEESCSRSDQERATAGQVAWLVDEAWPEYKGLAAGDLLLQPMSPAAGRLGHYDWPADGFDKRRTVWSEGIRRSFKLRRIRGQGGELRRILLESDMRIAGAMSRHLGPDIDRLVVAQTLLPHLWRSGALGGRNFSVLMQRFPLKELQARLDAAAQFRTEQPLLSDFRCDDALAEAEAEALAVADEVITPHQAIASLFPGRAQALEWHLGKPVKAAKGDAIAFPGPVAARKGAYALRQAARRTGRPIRYMGSMLEGSDFWNGCNSTACSTIQELLSGSASLVMPAIIEHAPRPALRALASGYPVLATKACGISGMQDVTTIRGDSDEELACAICSALD